MRFCLRLSTILGCWALSQWACAADALWHRTAAPATAPATDVLLDARALDARLQDDAQGGATIELPLPDGRLIAMRLQASAVLPPALAARYPQIRSYTAQAVDDSVDATARARVDVGPAGLRALILTREGRVNVTPADAVDATRYRSYRERDLPPLPRLPEQVVDDRSAVAKLDLATPRSIGGQVRRYRLALSTSSAYAAFHDAGAEAAGRLPDKAVVLAELASLVNRLNALYEPEAGIAFELVDGEDRLIFNDAAQDPYRGLSSRELMQANSGIIDGIIGADAYDIGHVLTTAGGGMASIAVACRPDKGAGASGVPEPRGDAYVIDYLAHEIGHQLGAHHSFNGDAGLCGDGRHADTAYEPGSGSSLMAYAGICDGQNLQAHSDGYLHAASFDEILRYTRDDAGAQCGRIIGSANRAPQASAGSAYTIPGQTPFELSGSGSDADGDTLFYGWEQLDLGAAGSPDRPDASAPLFRSFAPTESATRTFPQMSDLLANRRTLGEILPAVSRRLHFRLTVRDRRADGGGIAGSDVDITVSDAAGPFRLRSPNDAAKLASASNLVVSWDVAGTDAPPVSCSRVDIALVGDDGRRLIADLARATPNDGEQGIDLPTVQSTMPARIRIDCSDNIFFDLSDTDLQLLSPPSPQPQAALLADSTQGSSLTVNFDASGSQASIDSSGISLYVFDFGDGSPPLSQSDATATHEYASAGTYTASVKVQDSSGQQNAASVTVQAAGERNAASSASDDAGGAFDARGLLALLCMSLIGSWLKSRSTMQRKT